MTINLENIKQQGYHLTKELIEVSKIKKEQILVIGCSTSEVAGKGIGSYSSPELAEVLLNDPPKMVHRSTKLYPLPANQRALLL